MCSICLKHNTAIIVLVTCLECIDFFLDSGNPIWPSYCPLLQCNDLSSLQNSMLITTAVLHVFFWKVHVDDMCVSYVAPLTKHHQHKQSFIRVGCMGFIVVGILLVATLLVCITKFVEQTFESFLYPWIK